MTLRSSLFDDIYYNPEHGLEETACVFLEANNLSQRFARLPPGGVFTIAETGFGTGLNAAASYALFARMAPPEARLRFISTELYPLTTAELTAVRATWPKVLHPFASCPAEVLLGDAAASLAVLSKVQVDAWFFDGFSPAKNPGMWSLELFQAAARLSIPSRTTFGTFTAAGWVRENLQYAGFTWEKHKGFGYKRHRLQGVYQPAT
ncbi:MAG: tRNA (5-methylaminomethyl-2-thiouridine)(34)-methyltransferase MnmD [Holosporales bacterium]|jgi:tRNA 5-methylaminomethyl-2-thiouridine biosynthesis bifunctional protein